MELSPDTKVIPINMTDRDWEILTVGFIQSNFRRESLESYVVARQEGKSPAEAAYDAIRNEAVSDVLEQQLINNQGEPSNDNTGIV